MIENVPVFEIREFHFSQRNAVTANIAEDHSLRRGIILQQNGQYSFFVPIEEHIDVKCVLFSNQRKWKPLKGNPNARLGNQSVAGTLNFSPEGQVVFADQWVCEPVIFGRPNEQDVLTVLGPAASRMYKPRKPLVDDDEAPTMLQPSRLSAFEARRQLATI
jgi:hypothetical protein